MSTINPNTESARSNIITRGRRLKSLRKMADLSRKYLTTQYHISSSTLQSWEEGKAGGLTVKGAHKIILALRQEGVSCTTEWLLHGTGQPPHMSEKVYAGKEITLETLPNLVLNEGEVILKELNTFRQLNRDVLDMIIVDDGMNPFYQKGDRVAGKRYFGEAAVEAAIDRDCIVETKSGEILCRRVRKGRSESSINLQCLYTDTTVKTPFLYDVDILSAAPVIWHRKEK
jgi:transcriptional regulator with XRE-family HTH domain